MSVRLYQGECLDIMRGLPTGSVDAVVCDPPAGIAMMSREWDTFPLRDRGDLPGGKLPQQTPHKHGRGFANGVKWDKSRLARDAFIAFLTERLAAALRVAKPGAHLLCWAIPRTSHWTGTAIEDAGWTIEDRISHLFGTGFPKHKSKLKPACEDWWLATKPGGAKWLNVDGCRIACNDKAKFPSGVVSDTETTFGNGDGLYANRPRPDDSHPAGRWPANVCLSHSPGCVEVGTRRVKGSHDGKTQTTNNGIGDGIIYGAANGQRQPPPFYADPDGRETVAEWRCVEGCPVAELDRMSGERKSGGSNGNRSNGVLKYDGVNGRPSHDTSRIETTDGLPPSEGGASRFFATFGYFPKASRRDRGEGNRHPTVKSTPLMQWLCRLVTPPGGVILDPFMGSGSTGKAAALEGFSFIGIEQDQESYITAERRLAAAAADHPLFAKA